MNAENPYAPPESAMNGLRSRGDASSFWIAGNLLHLKDGASLPDVCLITGAVEGEMTRFHQQLKKFSARIFPYFICGLVLAVLVLKLVFAPWILLGAFFVSLYFRRSILVSICYSGTARKRKKAIHLARWGVVAVAVAFLIFTNFDPEIRLLSALAIFFLGLFVLKSIDPSFTVIEIRKKVAILGEVHPEALRQLDRWRSSRLRIE